MENMIRTFELEDTDKEVKIKVITPLGDCDNWDMLYLYTSYLINELKKYHEEIADINTLDDVLLALRGLSEEEKENKLTFNLDVWKKKEECYNFFRGYNHIVGYDGDIPSEIAFMIDLEDYEHLGLAEVQCEFSFEDYSKE
nr:MAG TPA: hypothetical protein [Caudoviricetes sp.]